MVSAGESIEIGSSGTGLFLGLLGSSIFPGGTPWFCEGAGTALLFTQAGQAIQRDDQMDLSYVSMDALERQSSESQRGLCESRVRAVSQ